MMAGALSAALLARRFTLLAEQVELMRHDPCERVEVLLRDGGRGTNDLDVGLVRSARELDLVCAYALRRLREPREQAAVLDVLGIVPTEYLLGILYALPDARRAEVRQLDGVWSYHAQQHEAEMPAALDEVERIRQLCAGGERARIAAELSPEELSGLEQFDRATLGLPADLDDEGWLVLAEADLDLARLRRQAASARDMAPDDAAAAMRALVREIREELSSSP
jgi:hypothetical protein